MKRLMKITGYAVSALVLSLSPMGAYAEGTGTNGMTFYDYLASNADKDTVIDFNEAPATGNEIDQDTNAPISDIGGLYMLQETKNDKKPMYFYRGNVENNNVLFNERCWLIVRTTETGGTKLLYNGKPTKTGTCPGNSYWFDPDVLAEYDELDENDSSTWPFSEFSIGSPFNEQYNSPADFGYMYGERFESESKSFTASTVFGNDVTYSNGVYTLQDTVTGGVDAYNAHHYTCLTTSTTCSEIYYEENRGGASATTGYFLTFTDGDTLETALAKMAENKHDSTIKVAVENWYEKVMTNATEYLEDTIWYGSKTFASGSLSTKDADFNSNFDQYGVSYTDDMIDVYYHGASRGKGSVLPLNRNTDLLASVDDLTNNESQIDYLSDRDDAHNGVNFDYKDENGIYTVANGTLKYPIGLLSNSEMVLAGNGYSAYAKNTYMDDNYLWWGLSPAGFYSGQAFAGVFYGIEGGISLGTRVQSSYQGIRPAVSLKSTMTANAGDGSKEHPFTNLTEAEQNDDSGEDSEDSPAEDLTTPVNPQTTDSIFLPLITLTALGLTILASKQLALKGRK